MIWSSSFDGDMNRSFLHDDVDGNGVDGDGRSFVMSVLVTECFLFNFFGCKWSGNLNTKGTLFSVNRLELENK